MQIDKNTYSAMPAHLQALFREMQNPGRDEVLAAFPDAKGQMGASSDSQRTRANCYGALSQGDKQYTPRVESDTSAARFFYCAKSSRADRNEGLDNPGPQFKSGNTLRKVMVAAETGELKGNTHPTVKPTNLMRYLCRLITPPGGIVLDPFMGSGSTGKGAILEGFGFIGIDITAEYVGIARARVAHAHDTAMAAHAQAQAAAEAAAIPPAQMSLID